MPDELNATQVPATTEGTEGTQSPSSAPVQTAPTTASETTPVAATPDWQEVLEKLDAKELRKHPKIAGIIGAAQQQAIQAEKQRIAAEEGTRAAKEAEANLRRLAQEDPVTFAEEWLTETQKRDLQDQLDGLRGNTRHEFAEAIGRAYRDVPEWSELTEDDHAELAKALIGKSDDEVIPVFHQKALGLIAEHRARRLHAQWKEKELPKERETIRQEEAAKLLKTSEAPDTAPSKNAPARVNIDAMSDAEFREYAAKQHGLRI